MKGARFAINFRLDDLIGELRQLGQDGPLMMARALNRAGTAGKTAMKRLISKDTGIQGKYIEREIVLDRANRYHPRAVVTVRGSRMPLIAFSARGPEPSKGGGRGVSYRMPGGRGRVPDAFIATVGRGAHRGVFKRVASPRRRSVGAWSPNLPIVELRGPSVPHVFEKNMGTFEAAAQEALVKTLRHEIDFARSKQADSAE